MPSITVTSALKAVSIQNDSTSPITGQLFGVLDESGAGTLFQVANTGATTIQTGDATNNYNSTTALTVQSAAGAAVFTVDTSNNEVIIGAGTTGEATPKLFVLDSGTSSSDPGTVVNGAMYYNNSMRSFRCGQDGVWMACDGLMGAETADSSQVSYNSTGDIYPFTTYTFGLPQNDCQPGVVYQVAATGWSRTNSATTYHLYIEQGTSFGTETSPGTVDKASAALGMSAGTHSSLKERCRVKCGPGLGF